MARLPDTLSQRPTPQPSGGVASYQTGTPGGVQVAQEMGLAGQQFTHAGNELQQAFLEEKQRVDSAKVEDAFNTLRNQQIDLTIGQNQGFMNVKGGDAVKQPLLKNWSDKFGGVAKSLSDGLDNNEQKQAFKKRADLAHSQFTQDILQHLYKENDVYQKQVAVATLDTETRAASAKWDSPAEVMASLERIQATTQAEAKRQGYGPDDPVSQDMQLQAASKVHAAVIDQAIASKRYDYAKSWFDTYRDQVDTKTAKTLEKAVEDAGQKQAFDGYQSQFLAMNDSIKGLGQLYKNVAADQTLDEGRKNILIGRIQSRSDMLEARAERARDRAERMLDRQISAVNALTLKGYEPTAEQMAPLVTAAKGTALEPQVNQMIATANATRQFRGMPFQAQEATISQMEAQARKDPTKFDVTAIDRFKTIHDNMKREVAADPVTFAVRQGQVAPDDPAAAPLNLGKPEAMGPQLASRLALARTVSSKYQTPVKPLTTDEVATLQGALASASPQQKRDYFGKLAASAGGDVEGYKAIMGQLSPDQPVTAIAGVFAGSGDPAKKLTADLILTGQSILHPNRKEDGSPDKGKLWPMPTGKDEGTMKTLFADQVRDAYAGMPKAQSDLYQASLAIYAAQVAKKGDNSGVLDSELWNQSVQMATGGVEKYRGKSTVMPWGMKYGDFKDGLAARVDGLALAGKLAPDVTADRVKDLPVQAVGDGKYVFRAGDGVLVGTDGKPVVIDFAKPTMEYTPRFKAGGVSGAITPDYGLRNDGTKKGKGFLGELKRPDGDVSTEISIGVNIGGKEMEIPTLVPTLTKKEVDHLLGGSAPTKAIVDKAVAHAKQRIADGKSPFAD